ncbi:MAG: hypothetical protein FWF55_05025 [Treponema sp.]|nr:hypothetical protein [Treponema sp.]
MSREKNRAHKAPYTVAGRAARGGKEPACVYCDDEKSQKPSGAARRGCEDSWGVRLRSLRPAFALVSEHSQVT